MSSFIANVVHILAQKHPRTAVGPTTQQQRDLAEHINDMLLEAVARRDITVEVEDTLDFQDYENIPDYFDIDEPLEDSSSSDDGMDVGSRQPSQLSSSEYEPSPEKRAPNPTVSNERKKEIVEFWQSGKTGAYSLSTVQKRFGIYVTSVQLLEGWKKQLEQGGSFKSKIGKIWNATRDRITDARSRHANVHGDDIRSWAIAEARAVGLNSFKASESWLHNFKKHNNIVSRKITKYVTSKYATEAGNLDETISNFRALAAEKVKEFVPKYVLNCDQSGFDREMHTGRTLDTKGVRHVLSLCQSEGAMTHSYTIMPTVNLDGELLAPLFVVLQEDKGTFGPKVLQSMVKPANLSIHASASGKMCKEHLTAYFESVRPHFSADKSLLVVDSWPAFRSQSLMCDLAPHQAVEKLTIPPKITGKCQPLDIFFFGPYKKFVRKIHDRVILDNRGEKMHQRDNTLKMHSAVFHQFCAPRYIPMIKYAWHKGGFVPDQPRPERFQTPVEYCFAVTGNDHCGCGALALLRCSYTGCVSLCFTCFIVDTHICSN